jgi:hypothetical protein
LWKGRRGLKVFAEYFKNQWIESRYNQWQIWHTLPGLATTNNPVERYIYMCHYQVMWLLTDNILDTIEF